MEVIAGVEWNKQRGIVASNTSGRTLTLEQEEGNNQLVEWERKSPSTGKSSVYSAEDDVSSLCDNTEQCELDRQEFFNRFNRDDKFDGKYEGSLKAVAWDLEDFYARTGQYEPKRQLPFAAEVLVGLPENTESACSTLLKLGLPDDFFEYCDRAPTLKMCPHEPHSFSRGQKSTLLGRLGGKEVTSKEPTVVSEDGIFHREFETHGRLVPLIERGIFMKRRLDQDLTAILNEHYKDTPEDQIPILMPFNTASEIMDKHLPMFRSQIKRRNVTDQESAVGVFMPVNRLETNVVESELQRRQNLCKRPPDLDEEKIRQMDRKRQNKIDSRARQKAQKEAAQKAAAQISGRF